MADTLRRDIGLKTDELNRINTQIADLQRQIANVINGTAPLADNQKKFDGFFLQYYFPQLTWLDNIENPANYNALYNKRYVFFRDYMRKTTLNDVRQYLLKITLAKMKEIVTGNYHPAARVNAMLIVAELNTKETVQSGGSPAPPDPFALAGAPDDYDLLQRRAVLARALADYPVVVETLSVLGDPDGLLDAAELAPLRAMSAARSPLRFATFSISSNIFASRIAACLMISAKRAFCSAR